MDWKKWKILMAIISLLVGSGMVVSYTDKSITVGDVVSNGDVVIKGK